MNRIPLHFEQSRRAGSKTLSVFVTAGFPSLEFTPGLLQTLQDSGADMIEVGIPFSDPLADGPVIQHSSETALRNGTTLRKIFDILGSMQIRIPILLMGYANTIFSYGTVKFLKTCAETGIDGVIIPDLSLEEGADFRTLARDSDIASVLLVAPTTPAHRINELDAASTGFLYCVSLTGVTGRKIDASDGVEEYINRVRKIATRNPLLVGFGISTPADALRMSSFSDGVIVGSALIKILQQAEPAHRLGRVSEFTRSLRSALDKQQS